MLFLNSIQVRPFDTRMTWTEWKAVVFTHSDEWIAVFMIWSKSQSMLLFPFHYCIFIYISVDHQDHLSVFSQHQGGKSWAANQGVRTSCKCDSVVIPMCLKHPKHTCDRQRHAKAEKVLRPNSCCFTTPNWSVENRFSPSPVLTCDSTTKHIQTCRICDRTFPRSWHWRLVWVELGSPPGVSRSLKVRTMMCDEERSVTFCQVEVTEVNLSVLTTREVKPRLAALEKEAGVSFPFLHRTIERIWEQE